MSDDDQRQQQEIEQERYENEYAALLEVYMLGASRSTLETLSQATGIKLGELYATQRRA